MYDRGGLRTSGVGRFILRMSAEQLCFRRLVVEVRASVAYRVRRAGSATYVYLSLFDDEIDDRFDVFLGRGADGQSLELTDGVVIVCDDDSVRVLRGASCTFPLYQWADDRGLRVTTHLGIGQSAKLSAAALVAATAAVVLQGSFEPNAFTTTPLSGWRRLRRGASTTFDDGRRDEIIEHVVSDANDEAKIFDQLRRAFAAYAASQRRVQSSVVELSGGYDSTLAAAARSPGHTMRGISAEFPFYEFRFEAAVQSATAAALGISRTVIDGLEVFPYAPWTAAPRFDEPSVFVTGIRHAEIVGEFARAHDATRIYTGHGGDHLFAVDLTASESASTDLSRGAFSPAAYRAIRAAVTQARDARFLRRSTGCFVYDSRQDIWAKERFGAVVRTPFTDTALFRAGLAWSQFSRERGVRPDKGVLVKAVPELLPAAVVNRRGKVAYDGVWTRAYATNQDHIGATIERAASILEHIGFSPTWLLDRVRALAGWQPVSDREVLAGYALSTWLAAWGLTRVSDVSWE